MKKLLLITVCCFLFIVKSQAQSAATPTICMVSVDTQSVNNIVYWDSTQYTPVVDSFIAYREVSSNVYKRVGAVLAKNHHRIIDMARNVGPANGNPNIASYRYKLQIRDTLGNYSTLSPYHQTVYLTIADTQNGIFLWNTYNIESQPNPVTNFDLMRDDSTHGNWHMIVAIAGNQTTVVDPNYASYKNTATWRVYALGFNCQPGIHSLSNNAQDIHTTGVATFKNSVRLSVYPNPANDKIMVQSTKELGVISIYNALGELILQTKSKNTQEQVDISKLATGVYTIEANAKYMKVIKE
jgi:hypothetical protein